MFGLTNGANCFKFGIPLEYPLSLFFLAHHHAVDLAQHKRKGSSVPYLIVCTQTLSTITIPARLGGCQKDVCL
jgi:hypothetical protein